MSKLQVSLAISYYDHVRDFVYGRVTAEGLDINFQVLPTPEIFDRATRDQEWDVCEMSLGKWTGMFSQGDDSLVPIPVFPSRVFRHSSIYVGSESGIAKAEDLAGKRIGVPEWAQTAAVYSRGMLAHEYSVDLASIDWHQGGVNEPGRREKVALELPPGYRLTVVAERSLSEMLVAGDLDAVLSARAPAPFVAADRRVRRLFPDFRDVELAYARKTGIFPIMHVLALRREVFDRHRWLPLNLLKAFDAARRRSLERAADITASHFPLPWVPDELRQLRDLMGGDPWPYGVDGNRSTLDAFLTYAFEQGVCRRRVTADELFPPEVHETFKV